MTWACADRVPLLFVVNVLCVAPGLPWCGQAEEKRFDRSIVHMTEPTLATPCLPTPGPRTGFYEVDLHS